MELNPGTEVEYRDVDWPEVPGWQGSGTLKTGLTVDEQGNKGYYLEGTTNQFVYDGFLRSKKVK